MHDTIQVLVDAYNQTPGDFQNPPDATIDQVINQVDKQIARDQQVITDTDFFYHFTDGSEDESLGTPVRIKREDSNAEQTAEKVVKDADLIY